MPGIEHCGRCGASLRVASMVIDVHPPRATRWSKRRRRWFPSLRLPGTRLLDAWQNVKTTLLGNWETDAPQSALFWRMIVPGWPQLFCKQIIRARLLFGVYVFLMLLGFIFLGTIGGSLFLGLAFSCHASSVLDVIFCGTQDTVSRIRYSLLSLVLLVFGVYYPAGWLVSWVVVPQRMMANAAPFQLGDVVLYSRLTYLISPPEPGDVVVYNIQRQRVQGALRGGNAIFVIEGRRIDRVLAGPGQEVVWENGELTVDGRISAWLPLNQSRRPTHHRVRIPANTYFIVPSTEAMVAWNSLSSRGMNVCLVSSRSIFGRVYLQTQPLSRFGWID